MMAGWLSEVVAVICGLILPRLILTAFGSSVNGLLSSIVQFLSFSVLLRAGVGAVTKAALFKPLAEGNQEEIDRVIAATQSYMKKISFFVALYILFLAVFYPFITRSEYDWLYTFTLMLIVGSATLVDNLVGIKYKILLQADQKYYVETLAYAAAQLLALVVSYLLIVCVEEPSIHVVKLGAAFSMFLSPFFVTIYTRKRYNLNLKASAPSSVIAQRWDAFAQHMSLIVNQSAGLVLLSFFAQLKEISVYTVHYMVCHNIEKVVISTIMGISSTFGNIIAKGEKENLVRVFCFIEWALFACCAVLFTTTAVTIVPFIRIYTDGVTDVNYIRPVFAAALTAAAMASCMRRPYQTLVEAAGHFKQTRNGAIAEVAINIVVSIVAIQLWGIIGVAIGSLTASVFRSIQLGFYASKHIIALSKIHILATYFGYFGFCVLNVILCQKLIPAPRDLNYLNWTVYALATTVAATLFVAAFSLAFNRKQLIYLKNKIRQRKTATKAKAKAVK